MVRSAVLVLMFWALVGVVDTHAQERAGTVLITGANRGLGLEFAKQYAARGWTVIATARDTATAIALAQLAADGGKVVIEQLDVTDRAAIGLLATKYRGTPIDVLLNNAGVLGDVQAQTLGSLDAAQFQDVMAVNVYGVLAMTEAFRAHVAASREKKVVAITSRSGIISLPGWRGPYFYRASKVARMLADDLRASGVSVALICAPPTDTDMLRALIGPEGAARQTQPPAAVAGMIAVIDRLTLEDSGTPLYYDGTPLPW
jgi:NAD(P)-dependent dehydrogenase (short-subunit alcohol dehydrogenase family)